MQLDYHPQAARVSQFVDGEQAYAIWECVIFSLHFNILDTEALQPVVTQYGQVFLEQEV